MPDFNPSSTGVNFGSADNDLKVQFFKGNLRATVSFLASSYSTSFIQRLCLPVSLFNSLRPIRFVLVSLCSWLERGLLHWRERYQQHRSWIL